MALWLSPHPSHIKPVTDVKDKPMRENEALRTHQESKAEAVGHDHTSCRTVSQQPLGSAAGCVWEDHGYMSNLLNGFTSTSESPHHRTTAAAEDTHTKTDLRQVAQPNTISELGCKLGSLPQVGSTRVGLDLYAPLHGHR